MTSCQETTHNYEAQFAHRFTAKDKEYQEYLQRTIDPPPLVEDWRGRGGGHQRGWDNRFQDQRPYRGRGRGWGWTGDQRGSHHRHDRPWGHSGGQQSSRHNSYGQGHNSYNQRSYERY
ncbi:RNA guanine-N7 methyltransferase activating subunit-like [Chanos chanos]|uniref:RNA guanine-N7 methyltransferase activating subunit n=1 Tax=Chanos chanos TaxID=29144 RepID=A0A6J2UU86_CHACN|nr:RNA guanine-N7 methyltransferase activating subunit [Chanos chanos]XP_030622673.1 RNA guanine-N7 methyltransferase activating subunit [Chanos chanos]